jgi:hypothetical protein
MKKEHSKRSAFGHSGTTPWCETCRAYRKISVKGGKKTCSNCGQTSIFVPAYSLTASLVCGGLCGLSLLITVSYSLGIVLVPAILFGLISLGAYVQFKKWARWAGGDTVRKISKKRLKRRKKKAEKREEARKAKAGETLSSPHPPLPPPMPPDVDDDED